MLCTAGRPSKCHTAGPEQEKLEEIDLDELRRQVRERLKRAEKVRRRGEEGERVRRRRGNLAILGDEVERREVEPDGGGRVNLGLRVDEMELREEIVEKRKRRIGGEEEGRGKERMRVKQSSRPAVQQLDNLSILGDDLGQRRGRRGSTARSSPTQLATIHEPGEEEGGRDLVGDRRSWGGEPGVVIRVTDLCEQ